jgi:hypothetical protein
MAGATRRLRRAAAVVLGLAVALLAAEAGTRAFLHVTPPLTEIASDVGVVNLPGYAGDVLDRESGRTIALRFNAEGFRGPDRPYAHPGVRRVAVLGDSMVAGLAVAEEETLTARLTTALGAAAPHSAWEVANWGVPGASVGQQLALYRRRVAAYTPDVVVATFFVGNDLSDGCRCLDTFPRVYFDLTEEGALVELPRSTARSGASRWLNRHSRFYVWQKEAVNRLGKTATRSVGSGDAGAWVYAADPEGDVAHAWAILDAVLTTFAAEVRATGAVFVLVVVPEAKQLVPSRLPGLAAAKGLPAERFVADHAERRLMAWGDRAGVQVVALLDRLRTAPAGVDDEPRARALFFGGHGHFTAAGHAIAAGGVTAAIAGR